MALFLKHEAELHKTYTVQQINMYPTGVQVCLKDLLSYLGYMRQSLAFGLWRSMLIIEKGVAVVSGILATSLCMIYPIWAVFGVATTTLLFCNICLLVWEIPIGLHCKFVHSTALNFH